MGDKVDDDGDGATGDVSMARRATMTMPLSSSSSFLLLLLLSSS
jgi:hypothetical protein